MHSACESHLCGGALNGPGILIGSHAAMPHSNAKTDGIPAASPATLAITWNPSSDALGQK